MQPTCTEEMLLTTAQMILEEAAFVFAEPVEEPTPWSEDPMMGTILFHGSRPGTLTVVASKDFCLALAANLLGDETENLSLESEGLGALGETLNMMCGTLTTRIFGDQEVCELGIPETHPATLDALGPIMEKAQCRAHLESDEGQRLDLLVTFS